MGTLGVWDQQSFKQTVVTAYSKKMQFIRPFYNLLACMQGNPRLPRAGANINILYAALLSRNKPVFTELMSGSPLRLVTRLDNFQALCTSSIGRIPVFYSPR